MIKSLNKKPVSYQTMSSNSKKSSYIIIFSILLLIAISIVGFATTYYVDATNGNNNNSGTSPAQAWKTISKANTTLQAGDTVYIMGGTYTGEQIAPSNSGSPDNRIVYTIYNDEVVTISGSDTPLLLSGRSYITITGTATQNIFITDCDKYLTMTNGDYNVFAYLTIGPMRNYERFRGFLVGQNSSYNWVHHCTISGYGEYSGGQDRGDMVFIGDANPGDNSHNLIEDNHFYYGAHNVISINGVYNVIRNNYLHNEEWLQGYGNRISSMRAEAGSGVWNLIEGNRYCFTGIPNDADYSKGIQCTSNNNIFRKNIFYNCKGMGLHIVTNNSFPSPASNDNYIYHNVFFSNGIAGPGDYKYGLVLQGRSNIDGTVIKNNIFHGNVNGAINYLGSVTNTTVENNWLGGNPGNPDFVNAIPALMTHPFDQDYPDFHLLSSSACIDSGAFLTTTTGSGSGTQIPVEDAHYFMNGWGIIEGDLIQLENQTQIARLIDVDYSNNILTIDRSLTWSANQGVSLKYNGSAPDLGAFESGVSDPSPPHNLRVVVPDD